MADLVETIKYQLQQTSETFERFINLTTQQNSVQLEQNQVDFFLEKINQKRNVLLTLTQRLRESDQKKVLIQTLQQQFEENKESKLKVKKAACRAIRKLQEGELGDEFLDPRPIEAGEMYERVEAKHILDLAQRIPELGLAQRGEHINWPESILYNRFDKSQRVPAPLIYPNRDIVSVREPVFFECKEKDVEFFYTLDDDVIPTSFTGEKLIKQYNPEIKITFPSPTPYIQVRVIAYKRGKLESIIQSRIFNVVPHHQAERPQEPGVRRAGHVVGGQNESDDSEMGLQLEDEFNLDRGLQTPSSLTFTPSYLRPTSSYQDKMLSIGSRPGSTNPYLILQQQRSQRNPDQIPDSDSDI